MRVRKMTADMFNNERANPMKAIWLYFMGIDWANPAELAEDLNGMLNNVPRDQGLVIEGTAQDWAILMITNHYGYGFDWVGRLDYKTYKVVVISTKVPKTVPLGHVFDHWSRF